MKPFQEKWLQSGQQDIKQLDRQHIEIFFPYSDIHHACSGVFSDEGVPQHLGQLAGSERSVRFVPAQSSNALLKTESQEQRHGHFYTGASIYSIYATGIKAKK